MIYYIHYENKSSNDYIFKHLRKNLINIQSKKLSHDSSNYKRLLLKPSSKNYQIWLEEDLLPNTRIIIEPHIAGNLVALEYRNGKLSKAISKSAKNIINDVFEIRNIPIKLPIETNLHVIGVVHKLNNFNEINFHENHQVYNTKMFKLFTAFQILNANLNQYSQLKTLQKLGFNIPPSEFTINNFREIELYKSLFNSNSLFNCNYQIKGIILKINSRKLQKQIDHNSTNINWSCSILQS
tara:strand:+ start:4700 stop:5416 length:717 start_codon:yes stop_codon:yes gene_type:complete